MNSIINFFKCLFSIPGCRNVHQLLFDYVQGNLDPAQSEKLSTHLRDCPHCLEYVETYKKTIHLTHTCCHCKHDQMPAELEDKLKQFIRTEL